MTWEVNRPEIVDEVRTAFENYEAALMNNDLETMALSFASSEDVVRFGIKDAQFGKDEIATWRATQRPLPSGRSLYKTVITTYNSDVAVVSTFFSYPNRDFVGRQQQTWLRFADRWKIVAAHVSEITSENL